MDSENEIYTYEDDEYNALSIKSCVKKPKKAGKVIKKRIKKKNKKYLRRKGKKLCCKKGIVTRLGKLKGTCDQPDLTILEKALNQFGLQNDICMEMFKTCCQDEIVGDKM